MGHASDYSRSAPRIGETRSPSPYRLIPYTYTLAAEARETGMPLMRAMWLHFPGDERMRGVGDQYLWGRDLLIAPVYRPGAKSRDVQLPEGDWYEDDGRSQAYLAGGFAWTDLAWNDTARRLVVRRRAGASGGTREPSRENC